MVVVVVVGWQPEWVVVALAVALPHYQQYHYHHH
jgi:hypothetical protein